MKRAVIVQDIRFQWRHGFYAVYAIVSVIYAGILHELPAGIRENAAQAIIYSDPVILGFLFAGGMVLLEKSQGVLEPLFASPLRIRDYLLGRAISLSLLSAASGLFVWISAAGADFRMLRLIPVVLAGSVCFTLLGLGLTARVETLNEFLVKSQFFLLPMALPLIRFAEPSATFWVAWMPGHAVLALLKGAWSGMDPAEAAEATALLAVWGILFYVWAKSSFVRYVKERIGGGTS